MIIIIVKYDKYGTIYDIDWSNYYTWVVMVETNIHTANNNFK